MLSKTQSKNIRKLNTYLKSLKNKRDHILKKEKLSDNETNRLNLILDQIKDFENQIIYIEKNASEINGEIIIPQDKQEDEKLKYLKEWMINPIIRREARMPQLIEIEENIEDHQEEEDDFDDEIEINLD